ncbi:MAG: hypothetical protein A2W35_06750 [Chloroflexi bacterium RBG_16_57_11]|nr:MAG: hypothetical protein A2W35_06750 [Chloroflexi bacterium RBG_16_57_11]
MYTKLIAVLITLALVFGGVAATASAAQESLPTDALYPVKTLGESVALGLSVSSMDKLEKALEHAQRRVDEMRALAEMGVAVPENVGDDYDGRVEYALRLAARMSDDPMSQALEKIQQSLQEQLAAVEQLRIARPDDAQLAGVEIQLRQHLSLVALGLADPQKFREQLAAALHGSDGPGSTQDPSVTEEPSVTETPEPEDDNSNDGNTNDDNTNDDNANANEGKTNGDDNTNDDDANSNEDDINDNDNDNNSNDDDIDDNDNDSNSNDDDNDNDSNSNDDDDDNGNDDDGNGNDNDDDDNGNDDDVDDNDDDDSNGNGDDRGGSGSGTSLKNLLIMVARMGGFPLTY